MDQSNIKDTMENIVRKYLVSFDKSLAANFYTKNQINNITSETRE